MRAQRTLMASLIWIHSFLLPTIMMTLFHPNFSNKAMTDLEILDDGGSVRANVKYVCGISDNFVSEHFYTTKKLKKNTIVISRKPSK
jgi:hypothetical protein